MHEQGSPEWHRERALGLTSTEICCPEARHPYKTIDDVTREKVRALNGASSEFTGNAATNHGQRLEPAAVRWYEEENSTHGQPCKVEATGSVTHPQYPWLRASPDGLVGFDGSIEVKCPYYVAEPYSIHAAKNIMYWFQVQTMLHCTNLEWCDFICYVKNKKQPLLTVKVERVQRDDNFLTEVVSCKHLPQPRTGKIKRIELWEAWHKHIQGIAADPELSKPYLASKCDVFVDCDDTDIKRLSEVVKRINTIEGRNADDLHALKDLVSERETLKKSLVATHQQSIRYGLTKIKVILKRGTLDYKAAFESLGGEEQLLIEGTTLESFRKKQTTQSSVEHGE